MDSLKLTFFVLLMSLVLSGNAGVPVKGKPTSDAKNAGHTPAKIEPYSTMDSFSRASSGTRRSDATYAYENFSYDWIDTSTGTVIPMLDDTYALAIPIGFEFPFYGIEQSTANVSANGFMSFYAPSNLYFSNGAMPLGSQPNGIIAPFWDDLRPEDTGTVSYLTQGAAGQRTFTVSWAGVPHFSAGGDIGAVTFQVTLYETTGDIVFRYQDVLFEDPLYDNGAGATIGVENGRGNIASVFSVNSAGVNNGDALRFYPVQTNQAYEISPEAFSWVDATTGQSYSIGDDDGVTIPLGFDFPYFATNYNLVTLSSNGYLTFGDCPLVYTSQVLPEDGVPETCTNGSSRVNAVIAPLWDDLNPATGGSIFALSQGVSPDRRITLSWNGLQHFSGAADVTFQTTLHENGDVLFAYQDADFGTPGLDSGANASIGIEDAYGASAARYSFRQPSVNTGQALRFSTSGDLPPVGAGDKSTFALMAGGSIAGWGENAAGQLGDLGNFNRFTPDYVTLSDASPVRSIIALANGFDYSLALTGNGRVLSWGGNSQGQLGDGGFIDRNFAQQIAGAADSVAVAAGVFHSHSLLADGTVLAWGWNPNGQLGNGTMGGSQPAPAFVLESVSGPPLDGIVSIVSGWGHTVALRNDGTMLAWGLGSSGQLGNGATSDSAVPVAVIDDTSATVCCATEIAAGEYHSLALMTDGTVMAWGNNFHGQLGDNSTNYSSNPVVVVDGIGESIQATAVFSGPRSRSSFAIQPDGGLLAWGHNESGQLGNGIQVDIPFALQVLDNAGGVLTPVASVGAGNFHTIARKTDGSLWVWGANNLGQLGFDPVTISNLLVATPIQPGTDVSVTQIAPATVGVGQGFAVEVTVQNNGPIDALGVKVSQSFPSEFSIEAIPRACNADGPTVSCLVGLLKENANEALVFQLSSAIEGVYTSTASVSAQQPDTLAANNSFDVMTEVASGDDCEPDNTLAEAKFIEDCTSRTFSPAGDVDWVQFESDGLVCDPLDTNCTGVDRGFPQRTSQITLSITNITGVDPGQIEVGFFDVNNQPITDEFNGCFADTNSIDCELEGYEGQVYAELTNKSGQFGPGVSYALEVTRTSPADEYYINPDMFIDDAALAQMGLEPYVRLTDASGFELDTVIFGNILSAGSEAGLFRLELWLTDPTGLTCANRPNDCIYTTENFAMDQGDAWNWDNTCCYFDLTIDFPDIDEDGIPDAIDTDNDNDAVDDSVDNCPSINNPGQANHDGDSFGDDCDDDDDADGVADTADNCPLVPNAAQGDANQNNIGDACDGTTEVAVCSAVSTAVPPNPTNPDAVLEQLVVIPDAIQNLRVQLQATHTFVGDLQVTLQHVDTTTNALLVDSDNCSGTDLQVLLDDSATENVGDQCNSPGIARSGILRPPEILASFNGESLAGTWRLTVTDVFIASDDGIVNNWCLFARVADADNDGIPDSADDDSDNDGVDDVTDNCPMTPNASQANSDTDSFGDACDNCTLVPNPSQLDTDADLIGNFCDPDIAIPNDLIVNFLDLNRMKLAFFATPASPAWNPDADLNGDNAVNFLDLNIMKPFFFGSPGPSGLVP